MKMTIGDVFDKTQKIESTIDYLGSLLGRTSDEHDSDYIDDAICLLRDYQDHIMSTKVDL